VLTRALACVLAAGLAAVLLLAGGQQAALAGGGPDGANPYGNVTCDKSYSPQCTVTAGSGPSAGTPASTGTRAGGQPAAGTAAAAGGGGAAGGCSGTQNKTFGCVPAGCQVTVQTLACPIGAAAPAGPPAGAGPPAPPNPAVLAALARQTLVLPSPVIRSSPAQTPQLAHPAKPQVTAPAPSSEAVHAPRDASPRSATQDACSLSPSPSSPVSG